MRAAVLGRLLIVLTLVLPPLDSFASPAARPKLHPCCKDKSAKSCSMKAHARSGKANCSWSQCDPDAKAAVKEARADGVLPGVARTAAVLRNDDPHATLVVAPERGFFPSLDHPPRIS